MYKEANDYDCQCCTQFIRNIGGIVYMKGNKLVSIWDVKIDNDNQLVIVLFKNFLEAIDFDGRTKNKIGLDEEFDPYDFVCDFGFKQYLNPKTKVIW